MRAAAGAGLYAARYVGNAVKRKFTPRKQDSGSKKLRRYKPRTSVSKTYTKTRKCNTSTGIPGHNDQSINKFRLYINKTPIKKKALQKFRLMETFQEVLTCGEGNQIMAELRNHQSVYSFATTDTNRAGLYAGYYNYFDYNPSQYSTGETTGPFNATINTSLLQRLNVESCHSPVYSVPTPVVELFFLCDFAPTVA